MKSFVVTSGVKSIHRILGYVISLIFVYKMKPSLSKAAVAVAQRNSNYVTVSFSRLTCSTAFCRKVSSQFQRLRIFPKRNADRSLPQVLAGLSLPLPFRLLIVFFVRWLSPRFFFSERRRHRRVGS